MTVLDLRKELVDRVLCAGTAWDYTGPMTDFDLEGVPLWRVASKEVGEFVRARDQFEAWDTLKDRPASDFGLVVSAEPDEMGDAEKVAVHTAALMFSWGRDADAQMAVDAAVRHGLGDTSESDRALGESIARMRAHSD